MKKLMLIPLLLSSCTPLVYTPADTVSEKELQLYLNQMSNNDAVLQQRITALENKVKQGLTPAK